MNYLSQFDLLQIRTRLQAKARQSFDVLNANGLQAALAAPRQTAFGHEMHSGLVGKAAILFSRLIENHPFTDGNKRIAVGALRLFLQRNQAELRASDDELLQYARRIVLENIAVEELESWLVMQLAGSSGAEDGRNRGDLREI